MDEVPDLQEPIYYSWQRNLLYEGSVVNNTRVHLSYVSHIFDKHF